IILECEGYVIESLYNGDRLFEKIFESRPDIILLDFSLPGETGDILAKKLKEHPFSSTIPIIMLSAHHAIEKLAASCGVNAFLPKPFCVDELLQMIEKCTQISTA